MSEAIKNKEKTNLAILNFAISSVITDLVANSLDNIINTKENVSSFLKAHFRYWIKGWYIKNTYLENADSALKKYYDENNYTYPNSLTEVNIDITNLLAIRTSLIKARFDPENFFENIRKKRNSCFHLKFISDKDFQKSCDDIRQIVSECPYINEDETRTYLKDLN